MTLADQFDLLIKEMNTPHYIGRFEPSSETPTVRSILDTLRDAFNRDWQREQVDTGEVDSCYFDYVASEIANAFAFRSGRQLFIGITIPMIRQITERSVLLSRDPGVLEVLGIEPSEKSYAALSSYFIIAMIHFVFAHELGHLRYGHAPNLGNTQQFHQEFLPGQSSGSPKQQAEELLADAHGMYSVLQELLSDARKEFAVSIGLAEKIDHRLEELLLGVVFIGVAGYFLLDRPVVCHPSQAYCQSHPLALLRVQRVYDELTSWCRRSLSEHDRSTEASRAIALTEALIGTVKTYNDQWEAQRAFMIADDGRKYEELLIDQTNKLKRSL